MDPMNALNRMNATRYLLCADGDVVAKPGLQAPPRFYAQLAQHMLGDIISSCKAAGIPYEYLVKGLRVYYPTGTVRYNLRRERQFE